jgi:hypothetical protein
VTPDAAAGADEMLDAIRKRRASKPPPAL